MEERQFEYLLTIASEKNISKAARKLFISQPSLSKFLINLENEVGMPLFNRNRNELEITKAGEIYVNYAERFLKMREDLKEDLAALDKTKKETISLGITPWISSYIAFQVMTGFRRLHPQITLNIIEDFGQNLFALFSEKKLDLVLSNITPPVLSKISSADSWLTVLPDRLLVVAPKVLSLKYGLEAGETSYDHPYPLETLPFKNFNVITGKPHQHLYTIIRNIVDSYQLQPPTLIESQNVDNCLNLVDSGLGIAFVSEIYIKNGPHLEHSDIFAVNSEKFDYSRVVYYHRDTATAAQKDLIGIVQDVCRGLQVSGERIKKGVVHI